MFIPMGLILAFCIGWLLCAKPRMMKPPKETREDRELERELSEFDAQIEADERLDKEEASKSSAQRDQDLKVNKYAPTWHIDPARKIPDTMPGNIDSTFACCGLTGASGRPDRRRSW